jgi:hypothetical protein
MINNEFYTAVFNKIAESYSSKSLDSNVVMILSKDTKKPYRDMYGVNDVETLYNSLKDFKGKWNIHFYESKNDSTIPLHIVLRSCDLYNVISDKMLNELHSQYFMTDKTRKYIKDNICPISINIFDSNEDNYSETISVIIQTISSYLGEYLDDNEFEKMREWVNEGMSIITYYNILDCINDNLELTHERVIKFLDAFSKQYGYDIEYLKSGVKVITPISEEISSIHIENHKHKYVYNIINTSLYGYIHSTIVSCNTQSALDTYGFNEDDINEISKLEVGDSWNNGFYGKGVVVVRLA